MEGKLVDIIEDLFFKFLLDTPEWTTVDFADYAEAEIELKHGILKFDDFNIRSYAESFAANVIEQNLDCLVD